MRFVIAGTIALAFAAASHAVAQPPNDDCGNATAVVTASLPFVDTVDTSTATDDNDTSPGAFSCADTDHSVWYQFTAGASDVVLVVDAVDGSSYIESDTEVYTGSCGALAYLPTQSFGYTLAGENTVGLVSAGQTVLICIADGDGTTGGAIRVTLLEAPDFAAAIDGYTNDNSRADVAANSSGDFLVVWGNGPDVKARLFATDGTPLSAEGVLGSSTENYVSASSLGTDEFVAAWASEFPAQNVLVRRVDASGSPAGALITANVTSDSRGDPAVAGNASGFVVVWEGGANAYGRGPTGRLFDTSGTPLTGEVTLASATTALPTDVSVGMDASGNFVVVWKDFGTNAIVARHFDATGTPTAPEFVVEQGSPTYSYYAYPGFPDVAVAAAGNFMVVWEDASQPGDDDKAIIARAFPAASSAGGALLQVNQQTIARQHEPRIAADADGNFVVVWEDDGSRVGYGSYVDVAGRRLDATGTPLGDEFTLATVNAGYQYLPNVAVAPTGEFMVVWNDDDNPEFFGPSDSVVARAFSAGAGISMECPSVAATTCRTTVEAGKSKLLIRNDGVDPNDLTINWKLTKGQATAAGDFGDPTASDDVFFCLYNDTGGGAVLVTQAASPAGGLCGTKPCWKGLGNPAGAKGFKYKDKERTPNGVLKTILKPGIEGRTKLVFKAGRANLASGPAGGPPAIPVAGTLTAQVHVPATGACWSATFTAATAKRNGSGIFQASSD